MASILSSAGVNSSNAEVARAALNGLPKEFNYITTALPALGEES